MFPPKLRLTAVCVLLVFVSANASADGVSAAEPSEVPLGLTRGMEWDDLGRVCSIAFAPDSRYVAVADVDRGVQLLDLKSGEKVWTIRLPPIGAVSEEYAVAKFLAKGKKIVLATELRDPIVIDSRTGRTIRTLGEDGDWNVSSVSVSRIDMEETVVTMTDGKLCFWNLSKGDEPRQMPEIGTDVRTFCVAENGRVAVIGRDTGRVELRELPSGRRSFAKDQSKYAIKHVAMLPKQEAFIAGSGEGFVAWRMGRKAPLWSVGERGLGFAVSPARGVFAYGTEDNRIVVRSVRTAKVVADVNCGAKCIYAATFSQDGSVLATRTNSGKVVLWQVNVK